MTTSNTLFVLTTDEGDHLMPQGELTTNLTGWLSNNSLYNSDPNNLNIYGDSGALVYLKDDTALPPTLASLSAVPGWNYVADPTELRFTQDDFGIFHDFSSIILERGGVMIIFVIVVAFLLLFLSGIYHLLQGIWELRLGQNRNMFVTKCMLGAGLIVFSFLVPYIVMFTTSIHALQPTP